MKAPLPLQVALVAAIALSSGIVGYGIASSATPDSGGEDTYAAPVEAAEEPETIVTEVEVEVASEACIEALDNAEAIIGGAAEGFAHVADAFDAAYQNSDLALDAAVNKLEKSHQDAAQYIEPYQTSAEKCREAE